MTKLLPCHSDTVNKTQLARIWSQHASVFNWTPPRQCLCQTSSVDHCSFYFRLPRLHIIISAAAKVATADCVMPKSALNIVQIRCKSAALRITGVVTRSSRLLCTVVGEVWLWFVLRWQNWTSRLFGCSWNHICFPQLLSHPPSSSPPPPPIPHPPHRISFLTVPHPSPRGSLPSPLPTPPFSIIFAKCNEPAAGCLHWVKLYCGPWHWSWSTCCLISVTVPVQNVDAGVWLTGGRG